MRQKVLISLFMLVALTISAAIGQTQRPNMSFGKTVHNFGEIQEKDGEVNTRFEFTNTGGKPVIIGRVKASCGCTSPSWSKKPVMPGQKGYIKAAFDPRNRPGTFNKSITVYSNAVQSPITLRIKGEVNAKPRSLAEIYRFKMDALRLKSNHAAFTRVYQNQKKTTTVAVVNVSDKPITIGFNRLPKHIAATADPKELQPEEKGELKLTYDASKINEWGYVRDYLYITINGRFDNSNRLYASASIQEDFSGLSDEEIKRAPKIKFAGKSYDFGKLEKGKKVTHEFTFTNEGKQPLKIRKINASCGCTATAPSKKVIQPGDSGSIKATFDSSHKNGRQNKAIKVITNDPKNHKQTLWIKGQVN